jgi:CcmD family protein
VRADLTIPDPSAHPSASPTATAAADPNTFRPTEGGNEIQSGERLMVEAYAAIWIIVFAFVLLSWRRQKALDARVTALEGAIADRKRAGDQS